MFAYLITFNKLIKLYLKFIKLFFTSLADNSTMSLLQSCWQRIKSFSAM